MAWKTAKSRKWTKKRKSKWRTAPSWTGAKMAKKWPKNGFLREFSIIFHFWAIFLPFLPLSSLGPFSISTSIFFFPFPALAVFHAILARQDPNTNIFNINDLPTNQKPHLGPPEKSECASSLGKERPKKRGPHTMRFITITDRLKQFQSYVLVTDTDLNYFRIKNGVTDTDLFFSFPLLTIGYTDTQFIIIAGTPPESQKPIREVCKRVCN